MKIHYICEHIFEVPLFQDLITIAFGGLWWTTKHLIQVHWVYFRRYRYSVKRA